MHRISGLLAIVGVELVAVLRGCDDAAELGILPSCGAAWVGAGKEGFRIPGLVEG